MKFEVLAVFLFAATMPIFAMSEGKEIELKNLTRFSELASDFNRRQGSVRIVSLLSPT